MKQEIDEKIDEKRFSGILSMETSEVLKATLIRLSPNIKLSVSSFLEAALEVPDDIMKPLVDRVMTRKRQTKRGTSTLAKKMKNMTPEQLAKIEAIMAETDD